MRIARLWSRWLALASLTMLAAAQPPPAAPEPEIVVRGEQEQALRRFVEALADPGLSRQLGRWDREICPAVIGVDPSQTAFMERRIGAHAAPLGLRARTAGCLTTMLIVVTADASGLAASFARNYPVTLRTDGRGKLNGFVASTLPVRWLSVTDLCAFGGCTLPNSRLSTATRAGFQAMIVIVDARQIGGFGLSEVSDYVSVVALGNPPLGGRRPPTSILSMFERDRPAGSRFELTNEDRAFLAGLYRSRLDAPGQEQRASIARRMRNDREH